MQPHPFKYVVAESAQHAAELLSEYGDDAKIVAGGQSLIPLLTTHLVRPAVLISINRVPELEFIRITDDEVIIGAATRDSLIERSPEIARTSPLLATATRHIGHPNIRNLGTIGGSLAHNDPAAEYPAVLRALQATVTIRSPREQRTIPVGELVDGRILETSLAEDEIVECIRIPRSTSTSRSGFSEDAPRHGDYAIAGVASVVDVHDGVIVSAAVAGFGGSRSMRLAEAEAELVGSTIDSDWSDYSAVVRGTFPTTADIHASREYRSRLAGIMAKRALVSSLADHPKQ